LFTSPTSDLSLRATVLDFVGYKGEACRFVTRMPIIGVAKIGPTDLTKMQALYKNHVSQSTKHEHGFGRRKLCQLNGGREILVTSPFGVKL
jgi:hypothetical protein